MDVLGSISSALSLCGKAATIAGELKNADLKLLIVDLKEQLANTKEAVLDLRSENEGLKNEIARLAAPPEMEVREGKYFKQSGDGPFCTGCYDSKGKAIRLNALTEEFYVFGKWSCPVCKSNVM